MTVRPLACRHCQAPISEHQARLGADCGRPACRHRSDQERARAIEQTVGRDAVRAAEAVLPGRPAVLLWLQPASSQIVPLPEARRQAHRRFLHDLANEPPPADLQPLAPAGPDNSLGPQEGRLCAQCLGRCCMPGASSQAFIDRPLLMRWQQAHPGSSLQDAADAYAARMAATHSRGGCVYQGPQGCELPREDRSAVCNAYACGSLVQLRDELRRDTDTAFVAVTLQQGQVLRQAVLTAAATVPLQPPDSAA